MALPASCSTTRCRSKAAGERFSMSLSVVEVLVHSETTCCLTGSHSASLPETTWPLTIIATQSRLHLHHLWGKPSSTTRTSS